MDVESLTSAGEQDRGFENLTGRLREESKRLAARYPPEAFTVHDLAKLRSGRRRRRWAVRAAAAVLFVAGGAWTWTALRQPGDQGQPNGPPPAVLSETGPREPPQNLVPSPMPDASNNAESAQAVLVWHFVITSPTDQGGRRVLARGVYIPEQHKEVTFDQLTPAEQYAVLRALGADHKPRWQL